MNILKISIKFIIKIVLLIVCCIGLYLYLLRFDNLIKYGKIESYDSSIIVLKDHYKKDYEFTDVEKAMIKERFLGIDIFNRTDIKIKSVGDVEIYCDEKDGHAWGEFTLKLDSTHEESLKKIFSDELGMTAKETSIKFSVDDNLGSMYIYSIYKYDKKHNVIELHISYIIPYTYKDEEIASEPEFVKYFLNLNENIDNSN